MKKGKKRATAWFLALCMVLSLVTGIPAQAADVVDEHFSYNVQSSDNAGLVMIANITGDNEPVESDDQNEDPETHWVVTGFGTDGSGEVWCEKNDGMAVMETRTFYIAWYEPQIGEVGGDGYKEASLTPITDEELSRIEVYLGETKLELADVFDIEECDNLTEELKGQNGWYNIHAKSAGNYSLYYAPAGYDYDNSPSVDSFWMNVQYPDGGYYSSIEGVTDEESLMEKYINSDEGEQFIYSDTERTFYFVYKTILETDVDDDNNTVDTRKLEPVDEEGLKLYKWAGEEEKQDEEGNPYTETLYGEVDEAYASAEKITSVVNGYEMYKITLGEDYNNEGLAVRLKELTKWTVDNNEDWYIGSEWLENGERSFWIFCNEKMDGLVIGGTNRIDTDGDGNDDTTVSDNEYSKSRDIEMTWEEWISLGIVSEDGTINAISSLDNISIVCKDGENEEDAVEANKVRITDHEENGDKLSAGIFIITFNELGTYYIRYTDEEKQTYQVRVKVVLPHVGLFSTDEMTAESFLCTKNQKVTYLPGKTYYLLAAEGVKSLSVTIPGALIGKENDVDFDWTPESENVISFTVASECEADYDINTHIEYDDGSYDNFVITMIEKRVGLLISDVEWDNSKEINIFNENIDEFSKMISRDVSHEIWISLGILSEEETGPVINKIPNKDITKLKIVDEAGNDVNSDEVSISNYYEMDGENVPNKDGVFVMRFNSTGLFRIVYTDADSDISYKVSVEATETDASFYSSKPNTDNIVDGMIRQDFGDRFIYDDNNRTFYFAFKEELEKGDDGIVGRKYVYAKAETYDRLDETENPIFDDEGNKEQVAVESDSFVLCKNYNGFEEITDPDYAEIKDAVKVGEYTVIEVTLGDKYDGCGLATRLMIKQYNDDIADEDKYEEDGYHEYYLDLQEKPSGLMIAWPEENNAFRSDLRDDQYSKWIDVEYPNEQWLSVGMIEESEAGELSINPLPKESEIIIQDGEGNKVENAEVRMENDGIVVFSADHLGQYNLVCKADEETYYSVVINMQLPRIGLYTGNEAGEDSLISSQRDRDGDYYTYDGSVADGKIYIINNLNENDLNDFSSINISSEELGIDETINYDADNPLDPILIEIPVEGKSGEYNIDVEIQWKDERRWSDNWNFRLVPKAMGLSVCYPDNGNFSDESKFRKNLIFDMRTDEWLCLGIVSKDESGVRKVDPIKAIQENLNSIDVLNDEGDSVKDEGAVIRFTDFEDPIDGVFRVYFKYPGQYKITYGDDSVDIRVDIPEVSFGNTEKVMDLSDDNWIDNIPEYTDYDDMGFNEKQDFYINTIKYEPDDNGYSEIEIKGLEIENIFEGFKYEDYFSYEIKNNGKNLVIHADKRLYQPEVRFKVIYLNQWFEKDGEEYVERNAEERYFWASIKLGYSTYLDGEKQQGFSGTYVTKDWYEHPEHKWNNEYPSGMPMYWVHADSIQGVIDKLSKAALGETVKSKSESTGEEVELTDVVNTGYIEVYISGYGDEKLESQYIASSGNLNGIVVYGSNSGTMYFLKQTDKSDTLGVTEQPVDDARSFLRVISGEEAAAYAPEGWNELFNDNDKEKIKEIVDAGDALTFNDAGEEDQESRTIFYRAKKKTVEYDNHDMGKVTHDYYVVEDEEPVITIVGDENCEFIDRYVDRVMNFTKMPGVHANVYCDMIFRGDMGKLTIGYPDKSLTGGKYYDVRIDANDDENIHPILLEGPNAYATATEITGSYAGRDLKYNALTYSISSESTASGDVEGAKVTVPEPNSLTQLSLDQLDAIEQGQKLTVNIEANEIDEEEADADTKTAISAIDAKMAEDTEITYGMIDYLDLTVDAQVGNDTSKTAITETAVPMEVTVPIPDYYGDNVNLQLIRYHKASDDEEVYVYEEVESLKNEVAGLNIGYVIDKENGTITFLSDRFSTFAIAEVSGDSRKVVDLSADKVKWDYKTPFTYDGTAKKVELTGLPDKGVTVTYSENEYAEVGKYTAEATFKITDTKHYKLPDEIPAEVKSIEWEIKVPENVQDVIDSINALPELDKIDVSSKDTIDKVTAAYNALGEKEKSMIDADTLKKLNDANTVLDAAVEAAERKSKDDQSAAGEVNKIIDALPATDKIAVTDEANVVAARKAYDELSADQKKLVSEDTLKKLTEAETALDKAKEEAKKAEDQKKAEEAAPKVGETVTDENTKATFKVATAAKPANGGAAATPGEVIYTGSSDASKATVSVPATITVDGLTYNVTAIADNAFKGNKKLTGVTIPNTVTTIGASAFENCTALKNVTIPASVTEIGAKAFKKCTKMTKAVIGKAVTKIGAGAFEGDAALKTVTFKGTAVETIGDTAFKGCKKLTSIVIPKSTRTIGKNAFYGCKKLTKITFKGTLVKKIGSNAFKGVPKKAKAKVPKKKLTDYKKLLKKAKFTGTVKK